MKNPLINGFQKIKNRLINWKSKRTKYDYFSYLSIFLGIIIGVIVNFSLQAEIHWIGRFSLCMFCASITLICYVIGYVIIASIVYAIKNFKK